MRFEYTQGMILASTIKRAVAIGVLALTTFACSQPTTYVPMASQAEIQAEQAKFRKEVTENPFPPIVEPVKLTKAMQRRLQGIANRINPQGTKLCFELYQNVSEANCSYPLEISSKKGANAYADGSKVFVTTAMMALAEDDTHLAFVLAHELAHNIMDHPSRVQQNTIAGSLLGTMVDIGAAAAGASTGGAFGQLGGQTALLQYSPSFELEADYIGLYILQRAGYRIEEAPNFWRAMAHYHPENIYTSTTHPTNPERYVVMRKTINEIRSKQKLGLPLFPEFKPEDQQDTGMF